MRLGDIARRLRREVESGVSTVSEAAEELLLTTGADLTIVGALQMVDPDRQPQFSRCEMRELRPPTPAPLANPAPTSFGQALCGTP